MDKFEAQVHLDVGFNKLEGFQVEQIDSKNAWRRVRQQLQLYTLQWSSLYIRVEIYSAQ